MTRKQSFAIYCKTGVDVRRCELTQEQISFILSNYWLIGRKGLEIIPGAVVKGIPEHKGDWRSREYDLLHEHALKRAEEVYREHETTNDKPGIATVIMNNGRKGFVKRIGKKYKIKFGKSLSGNREAAAEYCKIIHDLGNIQEISFEAA